MYRDHTIAVVIPAFNESELLPKTIGGLPDFLDQVIIVDDGSIDSTCDVANQLGDPRLVLLEHKVNQGVGRAITTGYQYALRHGADLIVVMGADDQMCPSEISSLLDPLVDGRADYTKGNRLGAPHYGRNMPWIRRNGTLLLSHLTRYATGLTDIIDSQCGFTAITRKSLRQLPIETLFASYGYPNDLLSLLAVGNQRVLNIVVTPIYRTETSNLKIHRVLLPIAGILVRALFRRLKRRKPGASNLSTPHSAKDPDPIR